MKLVLPGDVVGHPPLRAGDHVFFQDGELRSDAIGFVEEVGSYVRVHAVNERYIPRENDLIVGIIKGEKATGYTVDINSIMESYIQKRELREPLKEKTLFSARVQSVSETKEAGLADIRPLFGGQLLSLSPAKANQAMGKNGANLELIKRHTNATLLIGKNGLVWVKGGDVALVQKAIAAIDRLPIQNDASSALATLLGEKSKKNTTEQKKESP